LELTENDPLKFPCGARGITATDVGLTVMPDPGGVTVIDTIQP